MDKNNICYEEQGTAIHYATSHLININISLCITFPDCPGYAGKFHIASPMVSLCCKITPIKLDLDKGWPFVLYNLKLPVRQHNVSYGVHPATASALKPAHKKWALT